MHQPLVYIITLNWNRYADTIECLKSLSALTYRNKKLLVIDNGSTDGSPEMIASLYPTVELVKNPSNVGFASGINIGIKKALDNDADFVFIVNNDTKVAPDTLDQLIEASNPNDVGAVSPLIFYMSHPDKVWSAGANRNRITLEISKDHGGELKLTERMDRDFLTGCGMLIKRKIFENVGFFDDRFFMYYEDSDFSYRVRNAGYRLILAPDAKMWHKVSASTGSDTPSERYWMGRSSILFFRKHIRGWQWIIIIPWRFGSTLKTTIQLILDRKLNSSCAYIKGSIDGIFHGAYPSTND